jgi:signal transduction histidine kinase
MDTSEEIIKLKRENQELRDKLKELGEQTNAILSEKNEYLQNVAHQISSPLNNLKWSIESLSDPEIPFKRKHVLLRSIYSQATILVHLIKNFALMSALEAQHSLEAFREQVSVLDPKFLMINLSNDFQPMATDKRITIAVDDESFDKYSGRRDISGIKNLVSQVFSNILENAVKYSDPGTRILSTFDLKGKFAVVSISNKGLLIREEDRSEIFKRGFRGKGAKERLPAGTGFGLYIAQRIMDLHGGKIEVRCIEGTNIFDVMFPRIYK